MEAAFRVEPRVLARGMADGQRLELVQAADGDLAILQDGQPLHGMDWHTAGLEGCVRLYLGLLRQRPQTPA